MTAPNARKKAKVEPHMLIRTDFTLSSTDEPGQLVPEHSEFRERDWRVPEPECGEECAEE